MRMLIVFVVQLVLSRVSYLHALLSVFKRLHMQRFARGFRLDILMHSQSSHLTCCVLYECSWSAGPACTYGLPQSVLTLQFRHNLLLIYEIGKNFRLLIFHTNSEILWQQKEIKICNLSIFQVSPNTK